MKLNDSQRLDLSGPITFATHVALREKSATLVDGADVVVNWAGVEAVDSSALALILHWQRKAYAAGHRVEQDNVPEALIALAELYGVTHLVFVE